MFIPARTTFLLQPCGTHCFAAFKRFLRTMFEERLLESDSGTVDIKSVILDFESCYSQGDPRQGVEACIRWKWLVKSTAVGEGNDFDKLGVQQCARDPRHFAQPTTVRGHLPKAALDSFGSFAESLPRGIRCYGAHCPKHRFQHGCSACSQSGAMAWSSSKQLRMEFGFS